MKKGFTIVELIAAIAILSILLLISTGVINDIIVDSKKETYKTSALKLIEISRMYSIESLDFNEINVLDSTKLQYDSGITPTSGKVQTNSEEETRIAVIYDKYCITKAYDDEELTIIESSTCNLPN